MGHRQGSGAGLTRPATGTTTRQAGQPLRLPASRRRPAGSETTTRPVTTPRRRTTRGARRSWRRGPPRCAARGRPLPPRCWTPGQAPGSCPCCWPGRDTGSPPWTCPRRCCRSSPPMPPPAGPASTPPTPTLPARPGQTFDAVVERHLPWTLPDPGIAPTAWRAAAPGAGCPRRPAGADRGILGPHRPSSRRISMKTPGRTARSCNGRAEHAIMCHRAKGKLTVDVWRIVGREQISRRDGRRIRSLSVMAMASTS